MPFADLVPATSIDICVQAQKARRLHRFVPNIYLVHFAHVNNCNFSLTFDDRLITVKGAFRCQVSNAPKWYAL